MNLLLVEAAEDDAIIERVFLLDLMRRVLTEREHAVLALRFSGYTRNAIVQLLGIGKTTVYTCERRAIEKLKGAYGANEDGDGWMDTSV